jgi:alanine-glyoxylate transaminase/serine-glyoxylate transaminase/serine-pyruvate transaminase
MYSDIVPFRVRADEAGHSALLLVDGVSSVGAMEFRMDEWRVDVALTGSQKALSMPTGLGIVCASPKALEASKHATSTRGYFDWREYLASYKAGTYWPYTPAVQMLYGLRASLDLILKVEGLDNVIARHLRLAEATR